MSSFKYMHERFLKREIEAARFLKKGRFSAFLNHESTRFLVERMFADLNQTNRALRNCYKALGLKAAQDYWMKIGVGNWVATHIHLKRKSRYLKIGVGVVQNSSGVPLVEGDEVAVYQDDRGRLWVRRDAEFEDGRFAAIDTGNVFDEPHPSPT